MTALEQATIDFFRAVLDTGKECLGHQEFGFKIDATVVTKQDDKEAGTLIGAKIQDALLVAQKIVQPPKIETSLN